MTDERLATGALYPPVASLRTTARRIAVVVAREAVAAGLSRPPSAGRSSRTEVDAAMWWPDYVPYTPARVDERRRAAS